MEKNIKIPLLLLSLSFFSLSFGVTRKPNFELWNLTEKPLYYSIGNDRIDPMETKISTLQPGSWITKKINVFRKTKLLISDKIPESGDQVTIYAFPSNRTIYIQTAPDSLAILPQGKPTDKKTKHGHTLGNNVQEVDIKKTVTPYLTPSEKKQKLEEQQKQMEQAKKQWQKSVTNARKAFWKWHLKTTSSKLLTEIEQLLKLQMADNYFEQAFNEASVFLKTLPPLPESEQEYKLKEKAEEISQNFIKKFKQYGASELHEPKIRLDIYKALKERYALLQSAEDIKESFKTQSQELLSRLGKQSDKASEWIENSAEKALTIITQHPKEEQQQEIEKEAPIITDMFIEEFKSAGATPEDQLEVELLFNQALKEELPDIENEISSPKGKQALKDFEQEIQTQQKKQVEEIQSTLQEDIEKARKAFWKWHLQATKSKLLQELKELMSRPEVLNYFENAFKQASSFLGTLTALPTADQERALKERAEEISTTFVTEFKEKGASDVYEPKIRLDVYKALKRLFEQLKSTTDIQEVLKTQPKDIYQIADDWMAQRGEEALIILEQVPPAQREEEIKKHAANITTLFFQEFEPKGARLEQANELEQLISNALKEELDDIEEEISSPKRKKAEQAFLEEIKQKAKEREERIKEKGEPIITKETLKPSRESEWKTWNMQQIMDEIERLRDEREELEIQAGRERIKQELLGKKEEGPATQHIKQIDTDIKFLEKLQEKQEQSVPRG